MLPTSKSMEDYIKCVYFLMDQKGYVSFSEIAEKLGVNLSSVTRMVQKLDKQGYLSYEKYRGIILTSKGYELGKYFTYRQELLENFLNVIGVHPDSISQNVEGIEHYLNRDALLRIEAVVQYFSENPDQLRTLEKF